MENVQVVDLKSNYLHLLLLLFLVFALGNEFYLDKQ